MPPSESPKTFFDEKKNLYILLKSALKMQEMPFQRPKFQKISRGQCSRTPLQLFRHYGLPLTKILAMLLMIQVCWEQTVAVCKNGL